ncbi:MAG: hypothetical protein HY760_02645 [Nitrospirae bacterium]|nr:hypothetical protein [Nitrospirota bacterium]
MIPSEVIPPITKLFITAAIIFGLFFVGGSFFLYFFIKFRYRSRPGRSPESAPDSENLS